MKLLRRLVTLVWVATLLVTGCVLYLFNSDPVTIDFVWLQIPETREYDFELFEPVIADQEFDKLLHQINQIIDAN